MKKIAEFGGKCCLYAVEDPRIFKTSIENAKKDNEYSSFLTSYLEEDYSKMKMFLLSDGVGGVAVTKDAEIVSLFKNPSVAEKNNVKGVCGKLLFAAISSGGNKLDCYDGFLPSLYVKYGFVPVCKIKFKDDFASVNWNYERDKRPDIVFFRHNGDDIATVMENWKNYKKISQYDIPYVPNYELAKKMVNNEINKIARAKDRSI